MIDAAVIVEQVQAHYEAQYSEFIQAQLRNCEKCSHEVKFRIESGALFSNLYCSDFLNNDDGPKVVEFAPAKRIEFQEASYELSKAVLVLESLQWDRAVIETDIEQIEDAAVSNWFFHWFDENDIRNNEKPLLGNIIHSASINGSTINVDFGSADPQAFWDLIDALERAGARSIKVSSE